MRACLGILWLITGGLFSESTSTSSGFVEVSRVIGVVGDSDVVCSVELSRNIPSVSCNKVEHQLGLSIDYICRLLFLVKFIKPYCKEALHFKYIFKNTKIS